MIGAGTYADDSACAVSCTGVGEDFIRCGVAGEVAHRVRAGEPLQSAARAALARLESIGGTGGLIALDREGNWAAPFNTEIMFRAWRRGELRGAAVGVGSERG